MISCEKEVDCRLTGGVESEDAIKNNVDEIGELHGFFGRFEVGFFGGIEGIEGIGRRDLTTPCAEGSSVDDCLCGCNDF